MLTLEAIYGRCEEFGACQLWKQATINGHPQARINGKSGRLVRRYIFTELLGRRVLPGYVVIASCREPLCVAAECLAQITYSERLRRAYATGRRSSSGEYLKRVAARVQMGTTILDFEKAREIRTRPESNAELGREYGVHPKTIRSIRIGKSWRDAAPNSSVWSMTA